MDGRKEVSALCCLEDYHFQNIHCADCLGEKYLSETKRKNGVTIRRFNNNFGLKMNIVKRLLLLAV